MDHKTQHNGTKVTCDMQVQPLAHFPEIGAIIPNL